MPTNLSIYNQDVCEFGLLGITWNSVQMEVMSKHVKLDALTQFLFKITTLCSISSVLLRACKY